MGVEGLKKRYLACLKVAQHYKTQLNNLGIPAWLNKGAITVVFPRVSDELKNKWQLASDNNVSHIICTPNVTKNLIDKFVSDVIKEAPKHQMDILQ